MAQPVVDISMVGDKEVERMFAQLPDASQKKVVRPAFRKSAKRTKARIVTNLSGHPVTPQSGKLLAAMKRVKIRAMKRSRARVGVVVPLPTREEVGISPEDKHYYPAAVEYGHSRAPAKRFIRNAVNDHEADELRMIGTDIGKGIEREARRLARKR